MTVSLIISTYNWPRALYLCLDSVMQQTVMPSEILIADDGSGMSTRDVVKHFENISPVPVRHIWHEDNGFRLAAIRNKAIAASKGKYIIQIDGDLILQRNFIQDHMLFAREGCFVTGSRGIITELLTRKVLSGEITSLSPLMKGIRSSNNVVRIPIMSILYHTFDPRSPWVQYGILAQRPDSRKRLRRRFQGLGIRGRRIMHTTQQQRDTSAMHEIPGRCFPPPSQPGGTFGLQQQRAALQRQHPLPPDPLREGARPASYPENILRDRQRVGHRHRRLTRSQRIRRALLFER